MVRLNVTGEFNGYTTTSCALAMLPRLEGANLKKMLKNGDIRLNGCRIKADFEVEDGDVIEVYLPPELIRVATLDICYEDQNILIVNKQPGINVKQNGALPALMPAVAARMKEMGEYSEDMANVPFPCYDLDAGTGGLVLIAKNGDIFDAMREALAQRRVKRSFKAIVADCPKSEEGEFRHFYAKDPDGSVRVTEKNLKNSMPILTKYRVLKTNGEYSFVEIEPVTQCFDQERAHMAAMGYPILGDNEYGDIRLNKKLGIKYQALWATSLVFITGSNNMLEYLNGKRVTTDNLSLPLVNMG